MVAKHIVVSASKGGVTKTTGAVNLAACMAAAGKQVLIVDADWRGDVRQVLGDLKVSRPDDLYRWFDSWSDGTGDSPVVTPSGFDGLFFVSGGRKSNNLSVLSGAGILPMDAGIRAAESLSAEWDAVVWDVPAGMIYNYRTAMALASWLVIPSELSIGLTDVKPMINQFGVDNWSVVLSKYDSRLSAHKNYVSMARQAFGDKVTTLIPQSAELQNLMVERRTPLAFARRLRSDTAKSAMAGYQALAEYIMEALAI